MKYKNLVKRIGCKILFVLLAFMLGWLFGMAINFFHGKDQMTETLSTAAEEGKKQIAITFDDGPNPEYTMKLLEGLKKRGVKATFFVLGEEVERYPDIRVIVPHCGSFLPNIIDRLTGITKVLAAKGVGQPVAVEKSLKSLYFDIAGDVLPAGLEILLTLTDEDHLLFGGDFPYTPKEIIAEKVQKSEPEIFSAAPFVSEHFYSTSLL